MKTTQSSETRVPQPVLKGAKALIVGIANEHSIAYGCAKAFRELGADLALTYLNDKAKAYVEPLARELEAPLFLPLDFAQPGMLEAPSSNSRRLGVGSISSFTLLLSLRRKICRAAC